MNAAFNSKLKILIISTFFVLSSCAVKQTGFVDKRFNIALEAFSTSAYDTQLKPNEILSYSPDGKLISRYYNCKLLKNKMRLIKYECNNIQFIPKTIEIKKEIIFEIRKEKDNFYKDAYIVRRVDYSFDRDRYRYPNIESMMKERFVSDYYLLYYDY